MLGKPEIAIKILEVMGERLSRIENLAQNLATNDMDARIYKTEKKIKMSFLNILQKKELNDITVSELCRECNIHRKTFYAHYRNTSEIIEDLQSEAINGLCSLLDNVLSGSINNLDELFNEVNTYLLDNFEIYHLLAKTLLLSEFLKQLGEKFTLIISKTFSEKNISDYDRYSYYFLSAGISSLYSKWLINPEQENLNNTQYTNNVKDQGLDR